MKKIFMYRFIIGLSCFAVLACADQDNTTAKKEKLSYPESWNYESDWGSVKPECVEGKRQSPINITTKEVLTNSGKKLDVKYDEIEVAKFENVGYAVNALIQKPFNIIYEGVDYKLLQFHLHADSEHTIDHHHEPLELHLVHKAEDGALAVLGVMMEEGAHNPEFQVFLDNVPAKSGDVKEFDNKLDASKLIPANKSFYSYDGSLTTPGCGEIVNWIVFIEPIQISKKQIEEFLAIRGNKKNNRDVQELGDRVVNVTIN